MADGYLKFVNAPFGRWLAGTTGLPRPLPLTRYSAGGSALVTPLILGGTAAGRMNAAVRHVFDSTGTESAMVASTDAPSNRQLQGAVFDATGITDTYQLDEVYRFFHANVRRLGHGGRVLVLGTPPECCDSLPFAVAQRALEGLTRSLGKELRKAITVQLVCVEPGAEQSVESTLRFFLSNRSAYVSGQVVRVGTAIENPAESFDWSMPLAGRHALVTGASRGIGAAIAEVLAREGAHVICLDVAQAESALQQVGQATRGSCLSLDITAADAGEQLLQESKKRGGFDIVVHNAGITRDKTIARMSPLQWRDVMAVNLEAPLQLSQTLLAGGGLGRGARIVCVSSISGIAGNLGQTNYAASKAGVIGLVEQLAPRAAAQDVTVNAVAPGFIETGMTAKVPMMIREAGRRMNSMSQGGLPVDVAETVAWLAHPASGGINGQIVRVCGQSLLGA